MTNRVHDQRTSQTPDRAVSIEEIILKNVEEIQKAILGLSQRLGTIQENQRNTDEKLNRFDQQFSDLEEKIPLSQSQINALQGQLKGVDQRLADFDKRFQFVANKFTNTVEQIDHLDTEFGSLKTMILAAVDKAMKEYSNFVVEKLSLGNTIDTLRLDVDKLKIKIQRLEEAI
jgi:chromosome segregation ATPase